MRVLTYNIAGNGRRRERHLERVAELILKLEVDVVGLQEVVHRAGAPEPPDEALARLTGMHAEFVPAHERRGYALGNAVLTRDPILETVSHELPHPWPERRSLLEVHTTARGLPVTVFCTHLVHMARIGARLRLAQATSVAQRMATHWRPHILVGDLNAAPHARELAPVRKICVPHDRLRKLSSWPARRPLVQYDHIWTGPGWVVEDMRVLDLHVSDHRPVLAQLGWKGAPRYHIMPDEQYLESAG
jgi:endonuclease/exonuclease/phosphatase family metal-dependent hydrolase